MPYLVLELDGPDLVVNYYEDDKALEKLLDDYSAASAEGVPEPTFLDAVPVDGYRLVSGNGMKEGDVVILRVADKPVVPYPVTRKWAIG